MKKLVKCDISPQWDNCQLLNPCPPLIGLPYCPERFYLCDPGKPGYGPNSNPNNDK